MIFQNPGYFWVSFLCVPCDLVCSSFWLSAWQSGIIWEQVQVVIFLIWLAHGSVCHGLSWYLIDVGKLMSLWVAPFLREWVHNSKREGRLSGRKQARLCFLSPTWLEMMWSAWDPALTSRSTLPSPMLLFVRGFWLFNHRNKNATWTNWFHFPSFQ